MKTEYGDKEYMTVLGQLKRRIRYTLGITRKVRDASRMNTAIHSLLHVMAKRTGG